MSKMRIEALGRNRAQVIYDDKAILISYTDPVAALLRIDGQWKAYKTNSPKSTTTEWHIKEWLTGWVDIAEEKDQSWFDKLLP